MPPPRPPALGGSGEEQGSEDAGQQEAGASEAGGRPGGTGGAVAEVCVAAVDADPRQLLLLAVTGGGTAAGQQDAQDHCKASTGQDVRDRGVMAGVEGDALPALHPGRVPYEGCKGGLDFFQASSAQSITPCGPGPSGQTHRSLS